MGKIQVDSVSSVGRTIFCDASGAGMNPLGWIGKSILPSTSLTDIVSAQDSDVVHLMYNVTGPVPMYFSLWTNCVVDPPRVRTARTFGFVSATVAATPYLSIGVLNDEPISSYTEKRNFGQYFGYPDLLKRTLPDFTSVTSGSVVWGLFLVVPDNASIPSGEARCGVELCY